jgi:hypothetical protein
MDIRAVQGDRLLVHNFTSNSALSRHVGLYSARLSDQSAQLSDLYGVFP